MAALRKQKQYDWKDSNLAMFGSDTERQVKKESAEHEPAWKKAGKKVGLQIWRIVTYKDEDSEALLYDVHFWIGRYSTQVLYNSAEIYLKGGADSGFRQVRPEEYKTRLFHFHGDRKGVEITQIQCNKSKLDSTDVYILDKGLMIYQWNGKGANKDERFREIQNERAGKAQKEVLDEDSTDPDHEFYRSIEAGLEEDDDFDQSSDFEETSEGTKELFRLSDASGKLNFSKTKSGSISKYDFDTNNYLKSTKHPLIPVTCFEEGRKEPQKFVAALAA
ncbi:hypothetical protein KUTeg_020535 [Tegillarca granosa]|uniref:Gelsolin-like domain-containing protein n=1 Tax=Tegillarca granosa TaxID=220873 RepID=A0ABQ9E871_TEGGR|nr:hypothetical protein KUTeg_020535 [Tegillarca granosa]